MATCSACSPLRVAPRYAPALRFSALLAPAAAEAETARRSSLKAADELRNVTSEVPMARVTRSVRVRGKCAEGLARKQDRLRSRNRRENARGSLPSLAPVTCVTDLPPCRPLDARERGIIDSNGASWNQETTKRRSFQREKKRHVRAIASAVGSELKACIFSDLDRNR